MWVASFHGLESWLNTPEQTYWAPANISPYFLTPVWLTSLCSYSCSSSCSCSRSYSRSRSRSCHHVSCLLYTHTLWAKMNPSFLVIETGKVINMDANYVIRNCGVSWKNLEKTGCYSTSISSNSSNFCISGLCSPQIFRNVLEMIDRITVILCAKKDLSAFNVFVWPFCIPPALGLLHR